MDKTEKTIVRICENINQYGLERYDPRDIDEVAEKIKNLRMRSYVRKSLQVIEAVMPYHLRKILGCKKRLYPTTYTFLGEAFFEAKKGNIVCPLEYSDFELMESCISRYQGEGGAWRYFENRSFYPDIANNKNPTLPLYMLTRCNNLLARMGKHYEIDKFMETSVKSLHYALKNHTIFEYENGTKSISYYYNSLDCTLNVNSEVIDWIGQLPQKYITEKIYDIFVGILKLIILEQNQDGSWYYFSKQHMEHYGCSGVIDCHHSATIIYNLIHILKSELLDEKWKKEVKKTIIKGVQYFINNFFDKETGEGITIIGKHRKASSVQYSEALVALCEFVKSREIDDNMLKKECFELAKLIEKNLIKLVKVNGSVPGDSKIVPININCINWGNGAVLWALVKYKNTIGGKKFEEK